MYKLIAAVAAAFTLFILWIIYLANTGGSSIFFSLVRAIPYGDKLGHFFLFGFLTFAVTAATRFKTFTWGRFRIFHGSMLVSIFVLAEELSQALIPSRTFDLVDLVADTLGILTASAVAA